MECPYCSSEEVCEHLLLIVDTTFREARSGPLYRWFNGAWSAILEEHEEDDDFREAEPYDQLLENLDSHADAAQDGEFEGGPGNSSALHGYYCSSLDRVLAAVSKLTEG
jgi:hypothetical protein